MTICCFQVSWPEKSQSPSLFESGVLKRTRICTRLRNPGIDAKESIPPAHVFWRAGTSYRVVVLGRQAGNRFLVPLKGLQIRAQDLVPSHPLRKVRAIKFKFLGPNGAKSKVKLIILPLGTEIYVPIKNKKIKTYCG
jgi:hypothetical protein